MLNNLFEGSPLELDEPISTDTNQATSLLKGDHLPQWFFHSNIKYLTYDNSSLNIWWRSSAQKGHKK